MKGRASVEDIMFLLYPTGLKYSLELMFAKFATAKIAKDLIPLKVLYLQALDVKNELCWGVALGLMVPQNAIYWL